MREFDDLDTELSEAIAALPRLPEKARRAIVSMILNAMQNDR